VAGVGSSVIGAYTTLAGASFGWLIGQSFNGTVRPLAIGLSILAAMALLTVLITERGRLFVAHSPVSAPQGAK
jgi:DHA1 family bicyclomycin/chloramphenicol resistance-like MFS transporter